jgi:hypothetical protein
LRPDDECFGSEKQWKRVEESRADGSVIGPIELIYFQDFKGRASGIVPSVKPASAFVCVDDEFAPQSTFVNAHYLHRHY